MGIITGCYFLYRDEAIEDLLNRLDSHALSKRVGDNIQAENDIILANAIYRMAKDKRIYQRERLKKHLYSMIKQRYRNREEQPIYIPRHDNYKDFFEPLFDYVWSKPFYLQEGRESERRLSQRTWDCQPPTRRILNNNKTLWVIFILSVVLFFIIGSKFHIPSLWTLSAQSIILVFALSWGITQKNLYNIPLIGSIGCVITAAYFLFAYNYTGAFYAKGFLCMISSYVLMLIAIFFNEERLNDQTDPQSTSY